MSEGVPELTEAEKAEAERKKLVRVSGGHKGAFTRLSGKVDGIVAASISTDQLLFEAESLLSQLHNRCNTVQKLDAQIILTIDDEDELFHGRHYEQVSSFDRKLQASSC